MKKVLEKYKERLINLSGRNRSLVCRRLPKSKAFDLMKLKNIDSGFEKRIIDIIGGIGSEEIDILKDYNAFCRDSIDGIKEKSSIEDIRKQREKLKEIKGEFEEYISRLNKLHREINRIYKETGRNELYIGYPFIEGKLKDGTFVKAPLFLIKTELRKKGERYSLLGNNIRGAIINKVLLLAIAKHDGIYVQDLDCQYNNITSDSVRKAIQILNSQDIVVNDTEMEYEIFKEYKKNEIPDYQHGELFVKYNIVLGQFPIANSIYEDYEKLIEMEHKTGVIKELIEGERNQRFEEQDVVQFNDEELGVISQLDFSQEKAVLKASEEGGLVIYGPPGTGKSQTIANIITNAFSKDQKVLVVSQKKAALDVIYSRLGELNKSAVIIHDTEGDKKRFYRRISQRLEEDSRVTEGENSKIQKCARTIDENLMKLEEINNVLHKKRKFGLTLHEMYGRTHEIKSLEDKRYHEYVRFRQNKFLCSLKYEVLKKEMKGICENDIRYLNIYKEINKENAYIRFVKRNRNFMEVQESIQEVENLRSYLKTFISGTDDKRWILRRLRDEGVGCEIWSSQSGIEEKAESICREIYGDFLTPQNQNPWWSVKYWKNYSRRKKSHKENRAFYMTKEEIIKKEMHSMREEIDSLKKNIQKIINGFDITVHNRIFTSVYNERDYDTLLDQLIKAQETTYNKRDILKCVEDFTETKLKLLEFYMSIENGDIMEYSILYNISLVEKQEGIQERLDSLSSFVNITREINKAMEQKTKEVKRQLQKNSQVKVYRVQDENDFKEFKRQAQKKRQLYPIRKYFELYGDKVLELYPCFLLRPEIVSEVLPLQEGMFDLVIFDEASQIYVENAIPSLFRAKRAVIAGDDKQLRPSSLFSNRYVEDMEEDEEENIKAAMEEESLLDLAKVNYRGVHLNYHYRSIYEELINFSNYAFYGGELNISPNKDVDTDDRAIKRIKVQGIWKDRKNLIEAETIVKSIEEILRNRKYGESIGVITFNIEQRNLIEESLDKRADENQEFKDLLENELERFECGEDRSLFVKNIENVQGDERDIILFSTAYAKGKNGRVSVNFGSLSRKGGENRLNVAITRAKKRIIVVTSIEPEELEISLKASRGAELFKKYLEYIKSVDKGDREKTEEVLMSLIPLKKQHKKLRRNAFYFEEEIKRKLLEMGYKVHMGVGTSQNSMDIGIFDDLSKRYILGLECHGYTCDNKKSARERDVYRRKYLESRGWRVERIWSYEWWRDKEAVLKRIQEKIDEIS